MRVSRQGFPIASILRDDEVEERPQAGVSPGQTPAHPSSRAQQHSPVSGDSRVFGSQTAGSAPSGSARSAAHVNSAALRSIESIWAPVSSYEVGRSQILRPNPSRGGGAFPLPLGTPRTAHISRLGYNASQGADCTSPYIEGTTRDIDQMPTYPLAWVRHSPGFERLSSSHQSRSEDSRWPSITGPHTTSRAVEG